MADTDSTDQSNSSLLFKTSSIKTAVDVEANVVKPKTNLLTKIVYFAVKIAMILLFPILWPFVLKIVRQESKGVLRRFNKSTVLEPGVYFVIPFVESFVIVNTSKKTEKVSNIQAYSLDSFELSLSISYDYKVENVVNFDLARSQSHLLQALRNSISEETVEDVISGISDLERQTNKQLKRGGNLFGIKISNIVIDRVDIIGQLQFPKQEEVKEMSWEEEERLCEEAKKAADLLDQNPMALQLRILRSVEQHGKQNYNLVLPMASQQPEVYGHQTSHSILGDFTRGCSSRYQRIYMSPPHNDPIYDRIV